jgi:hypothetical protein
LVRRFTDAHTWPRREGRAMAAWVLITTLAVGYGRKTELISVGLVFSSFTSGICNRSSHAARLRLDPLVNRT